LGGGDTVMFGLALGHIVGLAEHAWCRRGPCRPKPVTVEHLRVSAGAA
jgi:hypothetical protein